jgi:hypothetical protein
VATENVTHIEDSGLAIAERIRTSLSASPQRRLSVRNWCVQGVPIEALALLASLAQGCLHATLSFNGRFPHKAFKPAVPDRPTSRPFKPFLFDVSFREI